MRIAILGLALIPGGFVFAQDAPPDAQAEAQPDAPGTAGATTTLETMRVTAPRPETEVVDLYRFRNPIQAQPGSFGKAWRETPSLEDIGKQGGIVPLAVNYLAGKVAQGIKRVPGWKQQTQYAVARPPPLDEAQARRAAALQVADEKAGVINEAGEPVTEP